MSTEEFVILVRLDKYDALQLFINNDRRIKNFEFILPVTKPGKCPVVSNSTRCETECYTDADCSADQKCCHNGCGASCLNPASEEIITTPPPYHENQETLPPGYEPARIEQPATPNVTAQEGGYVTMQCIVIGFPRPTIMWKKDAKIVFKIKNDFHVEKLLAYKFTINI